MKLEGVFKSSLIVRNRNQLQWGEKVHIGRLQVTHRTEEGRQDGALDPWKCGLMFIFSKRHQ